MKKSLLACLLFTVAAKNAPADDEIYFVSLAIFPVLSFKGCAFVQATEPASRRTIGSFHPSPAFMKAACLHFSSSWHPQLPADRSNVSYEIAVWHKNSPDTPTFMQMANM